MHGSEKKYRMSGWHVSQYKNVYLYIYSFCKRVVWTVTKTNSGSFFFWPLPSFVEFSLCTNAGTTTIQAIFDLCPRVLKRVLGYHSHDIPCASFQLLKIVVFYLEDAVRNRLSHTIPDGWIGKGTPISWLLRSPDVKPLNFLSWVVWKFWSEVWRR
jgi:hypothetical protein